MQANNAAERRLMIYGAYGYTGRLLAQRAVDLGLKPILAGRDKERLSSLAKALGCEWRAFDADDADSAHAFLEDARVLLNAAGPMRRTAGPLARACIRARTHYMDVSAELAAIGDVFALHDEACLAGVTLLPAAGYDVVPSDCLAGHVSARVTAPTSLEIGIWELPQPSRGTLRTVAEMFADGGSVRRNGRLEKHRVGAISRRIRFPPGMRRAIAVPWGDLITAHHSTGIQNITVYLAMRPMHTILGFLLGPIGPLIFRSSTIRWLFELALSHGQEGPGESLRESGNGWFYARASAADGSFAEAWLRTPEGYRFTSIAAIAIAERLLQGGTVVGATTPAIAMGHDFCWQLPGCRLNEKVE